MRLDELAGLLDPQFPPIAARMPALLPLTGAELSSAESTPRLGVSPASGSTMGRLLLDVGMVERRVSPETRRDLYAVRPGAWPQTMRGLEARVVTALEWLERASDACVRADGTVLAPLTEMQGLLRLHRPGDPGTAGAVRRVADRVAARPIAT